MVNENPRGGFVTRCLVVRGLVKEVEEQLNQFLSEHPVRVLHIAQSESLDHVTVTVVFEQPDPGAHDEASDPPP